MIVALRADSFGDTARDVSRSFFIQCTYRLIRAVFDKVYALWRLEPLLKTRSVEV